MADTPLEGIVRWASQHGFQCLEVAAHVMRGMMDDMDDLPAGADSGGYGGMGQLEIVGLTGERVSALKQLLAETGVGISAIAYYPNLLHPTMGPPAKECAFQVIDAAAMLGCNWTTQVGRDPRLDVADNLDLFEAVWPEVVDYAERKSVKIAIDNGPHLDMALAWPAGFNVATTPAVWRRIFEICPQRNFGLHLDTWHFVYQRIDPEYAIESFGDRIISVRASDGRWNQAVANEVGTVAVLPHLLVQQRVIGTGDLNLGNLFGALWRVGFNGDVIIEHREPSGTFRGAEGARKALVVGKRLIGPYLI
ncbi:sugar phosphate isomerase/epimerase [Vineibacter terrae]|uniref:Sugar phosphate isomerase/epimerase n=1 Tax=Vineibacter terrae TaxID=2586908 RepID=A0A5C8P8D0_9HYPH|nr:sugar phosphate isomerase/epimerase [Vineibacter terrae]TXL70051.1 sugar phosphate isomerase/epimerase [Vineibacter terrae]